MVASQLLLHPLNQMQWACSTLSSSGLCMVLWSRRGCSQRMCHVLALLRGIATLSFPFNPMTNLRPNRMVCRAMWDKKLEISVAIDSKACLTIALCFASPLLPLHHCLWSGCCMHLTSPEVYHIFFALMQSFGWWRVRLRRRSAWHQLPSV